MVHCAGMKCGDLVVVAIGRDERLRRECAPNLAHMPLRYIERVETLAIRCIIVPDRRHDERIAAQDLQRVRDIAGTAAEFPSHIWNQKSDIENVQLIRKYV